MSQSLDEKTDQQTRLSRILQLLFIGGCLGPLGCLGVAVVPLLRKKYCLSEEKALGVYILMIVTVVFLGMGTFVAWRAIDAHVINTQEPEIPPGIPEDTPLIDVGITSDHDSYILPSDQEVKLRVLFDKQTSLEGHWSGSNPRLTSSVPIVASGGNTHTATWGTINPSMFKSDTYEPWMHIRFKVADIDPHQWISVTAGLTVTYPELESYWGDVPLTDYAGTYRNASHRLTREIQCFVVSPEEYDMLVEHKVWAGRQRLKWWYVGIALGMLALVIALAVFGIRQVRSARDVPATPE